MSKKYDLITVCNYDILCSMLAQSREELYDYEISFDTNMINDPRYVIIEMKKEILKLRQELEK